MFIEKVKHYVEQYQTTCPAAPYTGYMLLGFLAFVLFVLWRAAAARAKVAKARLATWEQIYDGDSSTGGINETKAFDTIVKANAESVKSVCAMNGELVRQVLTLVTNSHNNSLNTIDSIVGSFAPESED